MKVQCIGAGLTIKFEKCKMCNNNVILNKRRRSNYCSLAIVTPEILLAIKETNYHKGPREDSLSKAAVLC